MTDEGRKDAELESSPGAPSSRRQMLAVMGAGGAALAATLASREQAWAGHDGTNVFHLGQDNVATAPTVLSADPLGLGVVGAALRVFNAAAGGIEEGVAAVQGETGSGVAGRFISSSGESLHCDGPGGLFCNSEGGAFTVGNEHAAGDGISASAHGHHAIEGVLLSNDFGAGSAGVVGVSGEGEQYGTGPGTGVLGAAGAGTGVAGFSPTTGVGVDGRSGMGIGVHASTDSGTALSVDGPARFTTVGAAGVEQGQSTAFVEQSLVTEQSHISVTLVGDPGQRQVKWVERAPGSGFTVHMTSAPAKQRSAVDFTYFVVEPG